MPTVQLTLDLHTSAKASYLAELSGKRRTELLEKYLQEKVDEEYKKTSKNTTQSPVPQPARKRSRGRRGQPLRYDGHDPRLEHGKTYDSYAHVVRSLRQPDLQGRLYDPKTHKGDNGESILERYEPEIHRHLVRV